jgi:hypothetical protein
MVCFTAACFGAAGATPGFGAAAVVTVVTVAGALGVEVVESEMIVTGASADGAGGVATLCAFAETANATANPGTRERKIRDFAYRLIMGISQGWRSRSKASG